MLRSWYPIRFALVVGVAYAPFGAIGQVEQVVSTVDNDDAFGQRNTDAGVSVHHDAIVSTSNQRLSIFAKTGGTALETYQIGNNGFPFIRAAAPNPLYVPQSRLFDPRTIYDPENDRLWMIYAEENFDQIYGAINNTPVVHVAVSQSMTGTNVLDTLGDLDWWYYTGRAGDAGNGGVAFDFSDEDIDPFGVTPADAHAPFPVDSTEGIAFVDLPTIAVDDQAVYITGYTSEWDPVPPTQEFFGAVVIIPLSHDGGTKSILDGDRPDEDDFVIMRFDGLGATADEHVRQYAVQEPYASKQADNAQFFLSIGEGTAEQNSIRLGGLWYDSVTSQWEYTQRTVGGVLTDMPVGSGNEFFYSNSNHQPITPDTGTDPFRPDIPGSFISSAVLCEDNQGNSRIFAAHHIPPSDGAVTPAPENQWIIQWYVIDPDLADFQTTTANAWQPSILVTGRIDGGGTGDFYHPVIGVTRQGTAYIEYTYSDASDYPRMERVRLTSNYAAVSTTTAVEDGGQRPYDEVATAKGRWADFSDMQADPTLCKLWSVHTLVSDADPGTGETDKRDIWLFELGYNCFSPDMNGNGLVEPGDAVLFNDYYAQQDPRADADASGEVDAVDAAIFVDRYSAGQP